MHLIKLDKSRSISIEMHKSLVELLLWNPVVVKIHHPLELLVIQGLVDASFHSCLLAAECHILAVVRGDGDDASVVRIALLLLEGDDLLSRFVAVHDRHVDVHEDDSEAAILAPAALVVLLFEDVDSLLSVRHSDGLDLEQGDNKLLQWEQIEVIVVDE